MSCVEKNNMMDLTKFKANNFWSCFPNYQCFIFKKRPVQRKNLETLAVNSSCHRAIKVVNKKI